MKKSVFFTIIIAVLVSGCSSDEPTLEYDKIESAFREGYYTGYDDGLMDFQTEFNEEIRPAYNWLLENYEFYANNVCVISPDKTYHVYYGCWDSTNDTYEMMFISDAESYGYEKCFYCYDNMPLEYMPRYEDIVKQYEPDCPAYP